MTKIGIENKILKLIRESFRPVSTREISEKLNIAWHTADRYCLKLQLKNSINCYTIGKATAWFPKVSTEKTSSKKSSKNNNEGSTQ